MTTAAPVLACPDCRAVLTGRPSCAACGLRLTGPEAGRLWEVDQELRALDGTRSALLAERVELLGVLRAVPRQPRPVAAAPDPFAPVPAAPEWTPRRVQNLLLGLGGLLLALAATVFAVVTYDRLGAGGRAVVLVALTVAAAAAVPQALRRGLGATAETLTGVALVLAALDAYGLRTLGLGQDADLRSWLAATTAALAVLAGAYAAVVPVRLARTAAVVLAQLPVPLLLVRLEASVATSGLALAALAAVDLAVVAALVRTGRSAAADDVRRTAGACAALVGAAAALQALGGAFVAGQERLGALALLAVSALPAAAGLLVRDRGVRVLLHALPVVGTALAALAVALPVLDEDRAPLVAAAVSLLAVQGAALLPRAWRTGPVLGALAVAAAGVAAEAEHVLTALVGPVAWLLEPWSLGPAAGARLALSPYEAWEGSAVALVVLAAAAATAVTAGFALARRTAGLTAGAALGAAAVLLLPLGLDLSWAGALVVLLLVATAAAGTGAVLADRRSDVGSALLAGGTAVALLTAVWSTADRDASLAVLPLVALLLAGCSAALDRPSLQAAATGLSLLTATGAALAAAAALGAARDQAGAAVLLVLAGALGLASLDRLGQGRRTGAEAAAPVVGLTAVALAAGDPGWLSWVLAGSGLLVLAAALRPDRRLLAPLGGLLLSASSWVRLADAGVAAPEPYVLPVALVALALGHLRLRRTPGTRSWPAYGPGLTLLLLPSLLAGLDDASPARPLLVGLVALVVLLVGARSRLQAPLAVGAAVLAVVGVQLLGPYAAALPRWLSLGGAGVLLLAVGATYEQRLRELGRVREGYASLR